jgi:hypothetical protein
VKICNICHKISATDKDHTDCIQRRSIEIEDQDFKNSIAEKLNLSKSNQELGIEVKAILDYLTKEKDQEDKS